jgi:hypothetical protein
MMTEIICLASPHDWHSEVTVALQGTLDTFALPDVLRLLSSTKKTGRLRVSGNRGTGSVWVDNGGVVATEASGVLDVTTPVDVVFELLRYAEGSFTFEAGTLPSDPAKPTDVEPLLVDAERQLLEWKDIEAVVPSLDAWVSLAPELPVTEVVVDGPRWRTIVSVGSGTSVAAVGHALGLGEVSVSRLVKELVELGLAQVSAMPAPAVAMVAEAVPFAEPAPVAAEMPVASFAAPEPRGGLRSRARGRTRVRRGGRSGRGGRSRPPAREPQPEGGARSGCRREGRDRRRA